MGAIGVGHELSVGRGGGGNVPAFAFSGALPSGATLARASAGARYNTAGVLVGEGVDSARFDFNPKTLAALGLLVEEQRTNLFVRAEQFEHAIWSANRTGVSANAAAGLDGASSADKLVPTTASGSHYSGQDITFAAGTTYALSVHAKMAGYRYLRLSFAAGAFASASRAACFDLQAGVMSGADAGVTTAIRDLGGGWYRVSIAKVAATSAAGEAAFAVNQTGTATLDSWAANGSDGILLWGAQLEAGAGANSYVATTTAQATRAADVVTLNWASRGVGDGAITVRYTFDDGSTQDLAATVTGGVAVVPTTLSRRWIVRVERV